MRKGFMGLLGWFFLIFIILIALGYFSVTLSNPRIDVGKEIGKMIFPDNTQIPLQNNLNFTKNASGMIR